MLIARKFLILIVSLFLFLLPTEAMPVYAQNQRTTLQIDTAGINYLTANYNTTVGLVRNSPDSVSLQNSYYLFSDNYLVALAFWSFPAQNASLTNQAENISKTTTTYLKRLPYAPNQYEALTSNVATFAGSKDYLLNKTGQERVLTTVINQTEGSLPADQFADIAFFEAVFYYQQYQNQHNS